MFGLLLTLCGSVLLAVMVAVRRNKEINDLIDVNVPVEGEVSPKVKDILIETYYFRTGLTYIGLGAIFQIFYELDFPVSELNVFVRLSITILGFLIILYLSKFFVQKIADRNFRRFPPYDPGSSPLTGTMILVKEDIK